MEMDTWRVKVQRGYWVRYYWSLTTVGMREIVRVALAAGAAVEVVAGGLEVVQDRDGAL